LISSRIQEKAGKKEGIKRAQARRGRKCGPGSTWKALDLMLLKEACDQRGRMQKKKKARWKDHVGEKGVAKYFLFSEGRIQEQNRRKRKEKPVRQEELPREITKRGGRKFCCGLKFSTASQRHQGKEAKKRGESEKEQGGW